jgi:hypothetical protein
VCITRVNTDDLADYKTFLIEGEIEGSKPKVNNSENAIHLTQEQKSCKNETTSAKCVKCNRNVISRGVYCSQGLHWVHYVCDKLTMC